MEDRGEQRERGGLMRRRGLSAVSQLKKKLSGLRKKLSFKRNMADARRAADVPSTSRSPPTAPPTKKKKKKKKKKSLFDKLWRKLNTNSSKEKENEKDAKTQMMELMRMLYGDEEGTETELLSRIEEALNKYGRSEVRLKSLPVSEMMPSLLKELNSERLICDPVIVACGHTFDRQRINKYWLDSGRSNRCPDGHILTHELVTPDYLLREIISQWFHDHGQQLPSPNALCPPDEEASGAEASQHRTDILQVAKEIQTGTRFEPSNVLFDTLLPRLTDLVFQDGDGCHSAVSAILQACTDSERREVIGGNTPTTNCLINAANKKVGLVPQKAIAALSFLALYGPNKQRLNETGVTKQLVGILTTGDGIMVKEAASLMLACIDGGDDEIREEVVEDGVVEVLVRRLCEHVAEDECLTLLQRLAMGSQAALDRINNLDLIACLLMIMAQASEHGMHRRHESSTVLLHLICSNDAAMLTKMPVLYVRETLSMMLRIGTPRACEMAGELLRLLANAQG